MAERTVNVTINYKVNTAEVQKAQQASQQAQRATDQLRKSAQQYGPEAAKSFKQSGDAARMAQRDIGGLDSQFNSLYNSVRLFLTAGIVKELVSITLSMAKLSGTVEGVEKAFNRLPNATLLLDDLRKSTHGVVNDLELMQKALMAQNFKIPLDKLGKLLEFAAVKAQQTGQEVNHLVNFIVSGIGYKQIKRLDDLGFTLIRMKEALGGMSLQAASVEQVMDAVFKLINEDLQTTGGYAETAATQVGQIETRWHELRVAIAEKLENSPLLEFFEKALTSITTLVKAFPTEKLKEVFTLSSINPLMLMGKMGNVVAAWYAGIGDVLKVQEIARNATEEAARIEKRLVDLTVKEKLPLLDAEIKKKQEAADAYFHQIQAVDMTVDKYEEENLARKAALSEIEETIKILKEYRESITKTNDDEERALGLIERKKQEIENLQDAIEETNKAGDLGAGGVLIKALQKAQEELDQLLGKSKKKVGEEVRDYLASLSELEMEQVRGHLEAKVEQRKLAVERELEIEKKAKEERERLAKEEADYMEDLRRTTLDLSEELIRSGVDFLLASNDDQVDKIRDFYDEQIELAGDNERAKKELRIKGEKESEKAQAQQAEREKKTAVRRILMDGLIAIGKIFSDYGWPGGIVPAAIMANITAINAATVRKYKKGGINIPGPGTETSDSIPSMLSKGESVMTAEETRKNFGLLTMMRENKISDKILNSIDFSGGRQAFSDGRIVGELRGVKDELRRLKSPDIISEAGLIYRVYTDDDGNKKRIRSKSI